MRFVLRFVKNDKQSASWTREFTFSLERWVKIRLYKQTNHYENCFINESIKNCVPDTHVQFQRKVLYVDSLKWLSLKQLLFEQTSLQSNNVLLAEFEGRTLKYWREDVAVWAEWEEVRMGQYYPVRLE